MNLSVKPIPVATKIESVNIYETKAVNPKAKSDQEKVLATIRFIFFLVYHKYRPLEYSFAKNDGIRYSIETATSDWF